VIKQTLTAVPQGIIQSGSVNVSADEITGLVDFNASVLAGVWVMSKTVAESDEIKIDPSLLLSVNLKPGLALKIGNTTINVGEDGACALAVNSPDMTLTGTAQLDLTGEYLYIEHIVLQGTVQANDVTLEFKP
jgi:hypothetical protein